MKLSDLVNYKMQLDLLSAMPVMRQADAEIEKITHVVQSQAIQLGDLSARLNQQRVTIQQSYTLFEQDLNQLKAQVKELIEQTERPWFQESYRLYEEEMIHETVEHILDRRPAVSAETEQFYRTRLVRYNSWKYPVMIIRPGRDTFINELLASDPLYLVDENPALLAPAINMFNEVYQNRLRTYTINERTQDEILAKLPDEQFGLVLAYHFFNFRPFEVIRRYFLEIHKKLRPGGVLVLTFNDCDRDKGVMLAERHFCCYTPGYLVKELARTIGFDIVLDWNDGGAYTWLELQKPGSFESLRGGQALAKIIPKPIAESK